MGSISTGVIKENNSLYDMNIYLEKILVNPGDIIKGLIQLKSNNSKNLNQNVISSTKINFIIKNIEYWQNRTIPNRGTPDPEQIQRDNPDDKKHYYENIVLSLEDTISNLYDSSDMNNTLITNRSELNIPIRIELPKDMNPSFEWSKSDNIFCYSRTILSINIPELKLFSNYYLFIQKNSPTSISPLNIDKIIGKKSVFFFWDNDNIKIDVSIQRDSFSIGDVIPIQISVDISDLKTKLNYLTLTIKRKIKFLVKGEQSIYLNTGDYIDDLWEEKIYLKNNNETKQFYEFTLPFFDNDKLLKQRKLIFLKNSDYNYLTFLLPSYSGQMIKCEYFIKIRPIFDGNLPYNDLIIFFDSYHNEKTFDIEAINETNNILFEINKMKKVNLNDKDNIVNFNGYSSSIYRSLPDEEMLKKIYSSNKGSPPAIIDK